MDKQLTNINGEKLPEAFLNRIQELLTDREYLAFISSYQQKRFYSLRVNPLKTDREEALRLLNRAVFDGTDFSPEYDGSLEQKSLQSVPWEPDGFYYPETFRPGRLPWHEAGMYYIQEASAMAPAVLCCAQPGERVLDLCAAPGGKSTKLAASMRGEGILVANEIQPDRAKILSSNLERMGVRNALVTNETPERLAFRFPLFFDRIVVDAPCSGEGMFRKEEEALTHWSPENVRMCAERQARILEEAASMLRPGGCLIYSTCTFSPEENEGTIVRFLQTHTDFFVVNIHELPGVKSEDWGFLPGRPEWIRETIPEPDFRSDTAVLQTIRGAVRLWPYNLRGEGHFVAVLQKQGDTGSANRYSRLGFFEEISGGLYDRNPPPDQQSGGKGIRKKESSIKKKRSGSKREKTNLKKEEALDLWRAFCRESLAASCYEQTDESYYILFGETLYLLPLPADMLPLDGLKILCAGLQLGNVVKGRFIPSHALGMALTRKEALHTVCLKGDSPEAYSWFRGETISLPESFEKGWCLICIDGCAAGWGKAVGDTVKNHYPKGLRKTSSYRLD